MLQNWFGPLEQCDQMVKKKVAQFPPRLAPKVATTLCI